MRTHTLCTLGTLALLALGGAARADHRGVTMTTAPQPSDQCPAGATVRLVHVQDQPRLEVYLPNFVAVALQENEYVTKSCTVWVGLKAPENYQIAPGVLKYEGKATVTADGDADITARYYLTSTDSVVGYLQFQPAYNGPFTVETTDGISGATPCGGEAEFNFMADLTAFKAGGPGRSEVKVQRGNASVAVPLDTPVFHVGLKLIRCF